MSISPAAREWGKFAGDFVFGQPQNKKVSCVEDNGSYTFAVLLGVSFAHRVM